MEKFNLVTEKIVVEKSVLMNAINTEGEFAITHLGNIVHPPYSKGDIFIFKGTVESAAPSLLKVSKPKALSDLFGVLYKIEEEPDSVIFDASGAWSEIVVINAENATYDDSTSDGIMDLGDKELEEMSWHSTEFGISNREISEVIEEGCDGMLFCIHNEEPFMFSSLIYIHDIECARSKVREAIKGMIAEKIATDDEYEAVHLTADEIEAARYFKVLV